jgi:hypothetical protein
MTLLQYGGKDAYYFELLTSLADWLLANKIDEIFHMPNIDLLYPQMHKFREDYSY